MSWTINNIYDSLYGCEESEDGIKYIVELKNENGEIKETLVTSDFLDYHNLDVGSDWVFEL